mgnify:CR=1 FL=1
MRSLDDTFSPATPSNLISIKIGRLEEASADVAKAVETLINRAADQLRSPLRDALHGIQAVVDGEMQRLKNEYADAICSEAGPGEPVGLKRPGDSSP